MLTKTTLFINLLLMLCSVSLAQIQIKVTLSGVPSSISIEKKNLKYGKYGAFCFVWDDRAPSAYNALSIMPSFTDGAGNSIPYSATVACNGVNKYGIDAPGLTFAQLKTLVDNNWGISCHGYIHNKSDWPQGFTVDDNVIQNRIYFYNKFKEIGIEYILRTGVVPSADTGYHNAWKRIGTLCGTSQNAFDTFPAIPSHDFTNNSIGEITNLTGNYQVFARAFKDINSQTGADQLHSKLTSLVQQSTATQNKILVYGVHYTDNSFLQPELNYLTSISDNIWPTSLHELMEYVETRLHTAVSYSLTGNVLTINLTQDLPDATRWRDLSLGLASDQSIVNIEYTGADNVTFNAATGLINVFKKKTFGFASVDVANTPLPIHFTSFSVINDQLQWQVAEKEDLLYYEIEKSTDGVRFNVIGRTSTERFIDPSLQEVQFYRIKAVEKNDRSIYSNVVRYRKASTKTAMVYKQGEGIRVDFYSLTNQNAVLEVFNINGQELYRSTEKVLQGWNTAFVPDLAARGLYIIKVSGETLRYVK